MPALSESSCLWAFSCWCRICIQAREQTQKHLLWVLLRLQLWRVAINTYVSSALLHGSDLSGDSLDGDVQGTVLILTLLQLEKMTKDKVRVSFAFKFVFELVSSLLNRSDCKSNLDIVS